MYTKREMLFPSLYLCSPKIVLPILSVSLLHTKWRHVPVSSKNPDLYYSPCLFLVETSNVQQSSSCHFTASFLFPILSTSFLTHRYLLKKYIRVYCCCFTSKAYYLFTTNDLAFVSILQLLVIDCQKLFHDSTNAFQTCNDYFCGK